MKPPKKLLLASLASTAVILSSAGIVAQKAFADTSSTNTSTTSATSPIDSLVAKIATKFGLKQADVQAVFDEDRTAHDAEMQQKEDGRLTAAVTSGELTQAQKDLIVAKQAELKTQMEAARTSGTDMKTTMDTNRTALETWAKDNGIDMKWLRPFGGRGHGGPGMGHGPDEAPSDSSTDSSSSTSTTTGN